jgi:hypothetical protein
MDIDNTSDINSIKFTQNYNLISSQLKVKINAQNRSTLFVDLVKSFSFIKSIMKQIKSQQSELNDRHNRHDMIGEMLILNQCSLNNLQILDLIENKIGSCLNCNSVEHESETIEQSGSDDLQKSVTEIASEVKSDIDLELQNIINEIGITIVD